MTWGPPNSLLTKDRGERSQPTVGRPARSAGPVAPAHGPHRLLDDTWRGVVDPQWQFGSFLGRMAGGSLL